MNWEFLICNVTTREWVSMRAGASFSTAVECARFSLGYQDPRVRGWDSYWTFIGSISDKEGRKGLNGLLKDILDGTTISIVMVWCEECLPVISSRPVVRMSEDEEVEASSVQSHVSAQGVPTGSKRQRGLSHTVESRDLPESESITVVCMVTIMEEIRKQKLTLIEKLKAVDAPTVRKR